MGYKMETFTTNGLKLFDVNNYEQVQNISVLKSKKYQEK